MSNLSVSLSYLQSSLLKNIVQDIRSHKYLQSTAQNETSISNLNQILNKLTKNIIKTGIAGSFTVAVREPIAVSLVVFILAILTITYDQNLTSMLVAIGLFYKSFNSVLGMQSAIQKSK